MRNHHKSYNRYLFLIGIFTVLTLFLNGCYSLRQFDRTDVTITKVYKIETIEGEIIDFRETELGYALLSTGEVVCFLENGEQKTYALSTIKKLYTENFNFLGTILTVAGVLLGIIYILIYVLASGGARLG